jgi:hypothetical protein
MATNLWDEFDRVYIMKWKLQIRVGEDYFDVNFPNNCIAWPDSGIGVTVFNDDQKAEVALDLQNHGEDYQWVELAGAAKPPTIRKRRK